MMISFKNSIVDIKIKVFLLVLIISLLSPMTYAHKARTPNEVVHQYITNESQFIWKFMPSEIKDYFLHDIHDSLDYTGYHKGEGIVIGSGEEDTDRCRVEGNPWCYYYNHFWDPDDPRKGDYDNGLKYWDSSFSRAKSLWQNKVIYYYLKGDKEKSYYWLDVALNI